jgi:ureidoacrylate peracid hydrolase
MSQVKTHGAEMESHMSTDVFSAHRHGEQMVLDKARTGVIVVDMINEFCKPGGAMVLPGYETLVPYQLSVIEAAREVGAPVFWVHDVHRANMRRDREWVKRTPHCVEGSWGTEIIEDLGARDDEIHIIKRRYSAFFQTDLDMTLKDMQINQIVVFGVVTNICVRSTVHDAFFNGYDVVVPQDCCAATGPREQESSLYDIATHFGVVSNAEDVVASLKNGLALRQV